MDDSKDLEDGPNKRFRKQTKRKAVDFNSTLMTEYHSRVLFPDNLNRPELQQCIAFDKELLPAASVKDNPASCVCTKLADTSVNKNNAFSHRCPVFAIAWTPEGRGLIAGNSQVSIFKTSASNDRFLIFVLFAGRIHTLGWLRIQFSYNLAGALHSPEAAAFIAPRCFSDAFLDIL